jgi:uncharacterized protein
MMRVIKEHDRMIMMKSSVHRTWPIPSTPWVMKQTWHDLLFAHWEIDEDIIRPLIPKSLELDTFDGKAYIGVVPFTMSGIRLRCLPPIPFTSQFPEINVRTYVTYKGEKPGVFFLSLDAENLIAVKTARAFFRLPYYYAKISVVKDRKSIIYQSSRKEHNSSEFCFQASYWPTSKSFLAKENSFDYWLTERYCLYTTHHNKLYRGDINHEPWKLQHADAQILKNTMLPNSGVNFETTQPILHYSKKMDVVLWALEALEEEI